MKGDVKMKYNKDIKDEIRGLRKKQRFMNRELALTKKVHRHQKRLAKINQKWDKMHS